MAKLQNRISYTAAVKLFETIRADISDKESLSLLEEIVHETISKIDIFSEIGPKLIENDTDALLDIILEMSRKLTNSDAGTVYMLNKIYTDNKFDPGEIKESHLSFRVLQNETMNTYLGGRSGKPIEGFAPVQLEENGNYNEKNVSAYCANHNAIVNLKDVYHAEGFNFSGTKQYDQKFGYRSQSMLVYPLKNHKNEILGVFQLINRRNYKNELTYFTKQDEDLLQSLSLQAARIVDSKTLVDEQKELFDAFIKMIAEGLGEKSVHTYAHINRVTLLGEKIAQAVSSCQEGLYADVKFNQEQTEEIRLAGWLHDIGKMTTPEHIVSKEIKLQATFDRFDTILERFNSKIKDFEIQFLEEKIKIIEEGENLEEKINAAAVKKKSRILIIRKILRQLKHCNRGEEFLDDEKRGIIESCHTLQHDSYFQTKIEQDKDNSCSIVAEYSYVYPAISKSLITVREKESLQINRGTLTEEERNLVKDHAERSWRWLMTLPFPKKMRRLPLYAGAHHEFLNGQGYPNQMEATQLPIQARILAIADIFEALSSSERPYRRPNKISEVFSIMGKMVRDNELDAEILRIFIFSNTYQEYANEYLAPEQIDAFDEQEWLLKYFPKDFQNTLTLKTW